MLHRLVFGASFVFTPVFASAQSDERSSTIQAEATVQSIDSETRDIVLENPVGGQIEVIVAGPEVVNFDQPKAGNTAKAIYTFGIAARIATPGELDSAVAVNGRALEGEKPGALSGTKVTLVLECIAFDRDASIATARDSTGAEQ